MGNILNLNLENNEAVLLASSYQNMNDRKEIYLKYLIIDALKNSANIVDVQESLFYSRKFYSLTRLFDFYVNNNMFDLIILKADSNETLFDVVQDEIHSNIYGYVVARVGADFKTAELLGYFLSKDFNKTVLGKNINVSELKPINNFEDIEIMESQMSLTEVSEKYFELLSNFMDNDLNEEELAEFACLLYNSVELREVFTEIGRFDSLCVEIKDIPQLIEDDFLSVFDGEMEKEIELKTSLINENVSIKNSDGDFEEEYNLDDLSSMVEEDSLGLDTEQINLNPDFEPDSLLIDFDELDEVQKVEEVEKKSEELDEGLEEESDLNIEPLELSNESLDALVKKNSLDELVLEETSSIAQIDMINEDNEVGTLEDIVSLDELETVEESGFELDLSVDEEPKPLVELLEEVKEENLENNNEEDLELDLSLDLNAQIEELQIDEGLDLVLEEDVSSVDDAVKEIPAEPKSRLAAELASLSLQIDKEDVEQSIPQTEESDDVEIVLDELVEKDENSFEIVEDFDINNLEQRSVVESAPFELQFESSNNVSESTQFNEIKTNVVDINEELLDILSEPSNDNLVVDDKELYSILGEDVGMQDTPLQNESINQSVVDGVSLQQVTAEKAIMQDDKAASLDEVQAMLSQGVENQSDLQNLYSNMRTTSVNKKDDFDDEDMPIGNKNLFKKNSKKTMVAVTALVLLVAAGIGTSMNASKNSKDINTSFESSNISNNDISLQESKQISKQKKKKENIDNDFADDSFIPANNVVAKSGSNLETSLKEQAGAAPVILKSVAWQVPSSISKDMIFNKYLQIAGKNIKLNLATDLLDTDDFAYNNRIKISMTVKNNAPVKNIKIIESSGSKNVDDIVLQSIKQTLKYINTPVMSEDKGDRAVVLVISI